MAQTGDDRPIDVFRIRLDPSGAPELNTKPRESFACSASRNRSALRRQIAAEKSGSISLKLFGSCGASVR
jgi:hypothetical protein